MIEKYGSEQSIGEKTEGIELDLYRSIVLGGVVAIVGYDQLLFVICWFCFSCIQCLFIIGYDRFVVLISGAIVLIVDSASDDWILPTMAIALYYCYIVLRFLGHNGYHIQLLLFILGDSYRSSLLLFIVAIVIVDHWSLSCIDIICSYGRVLFLSSIIDYDCLSLVLNTYQKGVN